MNDKELSRPNVWTDLLWSFSKSFSVPRIKAIKRFQNLSESYLKKLALRQYDGSF